MPKRHLLTAAIAQLLMTQATQAATIVVTSNADGAPAGDGACTLREALINANANDQSGSVDCAAGGGDDDIQLPAGQTITLSSALPNVLGNATITGNQARLERANLGCNLDGTTDTGEFRLLTVSAGGQTVLLQDFTMANGCADGAVGPDSQGGAFRADTSYITLQNMRFEDNQARTDGGAVTTFAEGVSSLAMTNTTFLNNLAKEKGGALRTNSMSPVVEDSLFSGNQAADGGAFHHRYGQPSVSRSTFSGNTATTRGGAISFMRHSASPGQTFTLADSTLSGNSASSDGGGIYSFGSLSVRNSTLSGNSVSSSTGRGGGIYIQGTAGGLQLLDSTLANNVGSAGRQIYTGGSPAIAVTRSLLSDVGGPELACYLGANASGADNIVTDSYCGAGGGTLVSASSLQLGPLQDNGGPTETHALGLGSTAIDAAGSGCSGTDQRGEGRPFGGACDAGAFEVNETATGGPDFVVNALGDGGDGFCGGAVGDCTLRDAIIAANSNVDASEITFDGSVFDGSQTIAITSELTPLLAPITITGLGDTIARDGGCNLDGVKDPGEFRLMSIPDSTEAVSLSRLSFYGGCADGPGLDGDGGAIHAGSQGLMLSELHFKYNHAYGRGGALRIASEGSEATLTNSTFEDSTATGNGGAISLTSADISISGSQFTSNRGYDGGAIHLGTSNTLSLSATRFEYNRGTHYGGAIFVPPASQLDVDTSTLRANTAALPGGAIDAGAGGGSAATTITRSLLAGNHSGDVGGAIRSNGDLTIDSSTLTGNSAAGQGGGIFAEGGKLIVHDSTLADNAASAGKQFHAESIPVYSNRNLFVGGPLNCFTNSILDGAGNVGDDLDNCGPGTTSTAIFLKALVDNGGPTFTRGLGPGSAAIDGAGAGCTGADQRGVARPFGAACDAGAFELDEVLQSPSALVVNAADDAGDGFCGVAIGECTLRDAVISANADSNAATISFDSGVFSSPQTVNLTGGQMAVTRAASILGPGRDLLTVDAGGSTRHFDVDDGDAGVASDVVIRDMTLSNGSALEEGGAIRSSENLLLGDMTLVGNTSVGGGGALGFRGSNVALQVEVANSRLADNHSKYAGGAIYGRSGTGGNFVNIHDSIIQNNQADYIDTPHGGGIDLHLDDSTVLIRDTTVSGNTLTCAGAGACAGGGIHFRTSNAGGEYGYLGLEGVQVTGNTAGAGGIIGGEGRGGGLDVDAYGSSYVGIVRTTIADNQVLGMATNLLTGGGVYLHAVQDVETRMDEITLSGNSGADDGGGMFAYLQDNSRLILQRSTLADNHASRQGGGFYLSSINPNGEQLILDSTVSGNTAGEDGGGILVSMSGSSSSLRIDGSTITDNSAGTTAGSAGGLLAAGPADSFTYLLDSILAGNQVAGMVSSPDVQLTGSTVSLQNSLIGDNAGTALAEAQTPDGDNNLIGSAAGAGIIDPRLRPLADNGGFTPTRLPEVGSPVIDHFSGCTDEDQRGAPRGFDFDGVAGNDCDIGAVEYLQSDDQLFADGFEQPPMLLAFSKRSAVLSLGDILQRLAATHGHRPTIVARAVSPGVVDFIVVKARRAGDGIELQTQHFDGDEWIIGRWQRLTGDSVELRW